MDSLVAIKIRIGLNKKKHHDYPDFNRLRDSVDSWDDGSDWCHFIDRFGGWKYDALSGHTDEDETSPRGVQFGMLCVPEDFAMASVEAFPEQVSILEETEAEDFYETRCTAEHPDVFEDLETLQAIVAKRSLGIEDPSDANALDPDHPSRGRRRNKLKTWNGYKQQRGIEIDAEATQRVRDRSERLRMDS